MQKLLWAKIGVWPQDEQSSYNVNTLGGGAEEDRTPDLCIANATLSQLSYSPPSMSPKIPVDALNGNHIQPAVIPAEAGIHGKHQPILDWIPAFARMTALSRG